MTTDANDDVSSGIPLSKFLMYIMLTLSACVEIKDYIGIEQLLSSSFLIIN